MKLKYALAGALLALGFAAASTAAAVEVSRTYVKGSYLYTCVPMGSAEYCGNFKVVR